MENIIELPERDQRKECFQHNPFSHWDQQESPCRRGYYNNDWNGILKSCFNFSARRFRWRETGPNGTWYGNFPKFLLWKYRYYWYHNRFMKGYRYYLERSVLTPKLAVLVTCKGKSLNVVARL